MIKLNNGFCVTKGINTQSEIEYMLSRNPPYFAFDKAGIDGTNLIFMTSDQYFKYLVTTEQFEKISLIARTHGYNILWSGIITKYMPFFLFQELLEFRENPLMVNDKDYLYPEEKIEIFKLKSKSYSQDLILFKHGYKNYETNIYGETLENSIKSICKKLKTNEITIRKYEDN